MITVKGKEILSRYLLGHTTAYASHISVGCGQRPTTGFRKFFTHAEVEDGSVRLLTPNHGLAIGDSIQVLDYDGTLNGDYVVADINGNYVVFYADIAPFEEEERAGTVTQLVGDIYSENPAMSFETARFPILSRGYDNDDDTKLIFVAELPQNQRYVITEAGLWSGESDGIAVGSPSRTMFTFAEDEAWRWHSGNTVATIPVVGSLAGEALGFDLAAGQVFSTSSSNVIFSSNGRRNQYEGGRIGDSVIALRGDTSEITKTTGSGSATGQHIHVNTLSMNFSKNDLDDELRLAFFVSTARGLALETPPDVVKILVEFTYTEDSGYGYARGYIEVEGDEIDIDRYVVAKLKLRDLEYSSDFAWESVRYVRVYASAVPPAGLTAEDFYVFLDGMRLENLTSSNHLYGMTGYSVVRNGNVYPPQPIVNEHGESGFIEFRIGIEVF